MRVSKRDHATLTRAAESSVENEHVAALARAVPRAVQQQCAFTTGRDRWPFGARRGKVQPTRRVTCIEQKSPLQSDSSHSCSNSQTLLSIRRYSSPASHAVAHGGGRALGAVPSFDATGGHDQAAFGRVERSGHSSIHLISWNQTMVEASARALQADVKEYCRNPTRSEALLPPAGSDSTCDRMSYPGAQVPVLRVIMDNFLTLVGTHSPGCSLSARKLRPSSLARHRRPTSLQPNGTSSSSSSASPPLERASSSGSSPASASPLSHGSSPSADSPPRLLLAFVAVIAKNTEASSSRPTAGEPTAAPP